MNLETQISKIIEAVAYVFVVIWDAAKYRESGFNSNHKYAIAGT